MSGISSKVIIPLKEFSYEYDGPVFVRGEGIYLYDDFGKKYIDAISGLWNVPFGYGHSRITEAVKEQAEQLPYINLYSNFTPVVGKYAEELLCSMGSPFGKMIYTCSGSESIECAIKLARKYQRLKGFSNRTKVAVFDISYHGTTYAAMAASGMDRSESEFYGPTVPGFVFLKNPFRLEEQEAIDNIEKVLGNGENVAAVIIEPVIGSAGVIPVPGWYVKLLKRYTEERGILLIFDEVATGFGRTGNLFCYMDMEVFPDIVCLSKGIDNGMIPMGAVVLKKEFVDYFEFNRQYVEHFSTQNGNPIACAAALEVLKLLNAPSTLDYVKYIGKYIYNQLDEKLSELLCVRELRGKGLMLAIDLATADNKQFTMEQLYAVEKEAKKKGVIVYPFYMENVTSGINLFPSYIIDEHASDRIIDVLYKILKRY